MIMRTKRSIVYTLDVRLYLMLLRDNIEPKVYLVDYWNVIIDISACIWVVNI